MDSAELFYRFFELDECPEEIPGCHALKMTYKRDRKNVIKSNPNCHGCAELDLQKRYMKTINNLIQVK